MSNKPTYKELEKENKRLREKRNSETKDNQFNSYFDNNQAVMLQIDVETKQIIKANKAAVNFYKYPEEELLKKTINDLNLLSESEIQKRMSEAIKNKSNIFKFQHKTAIGEIKDVEVYASPFSFGDEIHIFTTILDISERKKNENDLKKQNEEYASLNEEYLAINEELAEKNKEYFALNEEYKSQNEALKKAKEIAEESEQRFKDLTNLLPQIIYECDIEGNLTYVNEQAFEFFRYTREDFEKGINL
ncbi:MAG: PAS domain S-box protein, partial [Bacteroidales bacterium]|nr:PAS domain S-box protein [Bacteroidales bacterium]